MRRALPFVLVLVTLLASAGGGVAGWQLNRREHRLELAAARARAEAAAARAADVYRSGLGPVVADVADITAVQQLLQSVDSLTRQDLAAALRLDELAGRAQARLTALVVPARLAEQARQVTQAMTSLRRATSALRSAGRGRGTAGLVSSALDQVQASSDSWSLAIQPLLGAGVNRYATSSHALRDAADYLSDLDGTCSVGAAALSRLPLKTDADFKAHADAFADSVTRTIDQLRRQLAAHPGTAALRGQLAAVLPLATGLHEELRGIRERSLREAEAGYHKAHAAEAFLDPVSQRVKSLGASWCVLYFRTHSAATTRSVTA